MEKQVISQNVDGLHLRSGLKSEALIELHGNINFEKCKECGTSYYRDFGTREHPPNQLKHGTSRKCQQCLGHLEDTIVLFGEKIKGGAFERAMETAEQSQMCLAIGSSLIVNPAAQIPFHFVSKNKKLAIVNLQETRFEPMAEVALHEMSQNFSLALAESIGFSLPLPFIYERRLLIELQKEKVVLRTTDSQKRPMTFLSWVRMRKGDLEIDFANEPFELDRKVMESHQSERISLHLEFSSHYGEKLLIVDLDEGNLKYLREKGSIKVALRLNSETKEQSFEIICD